MIRISRRNIPRLPVRATSKIRRKTEHRRRRREESHSSATNRRSETPHVVSYGFKNLSCAAGAARYCVLNSGARSTSLLWFMTLTEKILARPSGQAPGKARVEAGDNVWVQADVLMTHDVCGPGTIGVFHREFGKAAKVWDRNKVVI